MRASAAGPLALALAVAVAGGACTRRDPQAGPSPSPSPPGAATPAPQAAAVPSLPADKAGRAAVVAAWFKGLDRVCAAWRAQVGTPLEMDPNPFHGATVGDERAPGVWVVTDGEGRRLLADTTGWAESKAPGMFPPGIPAPAPGAWIVTSPDGPTGLMPPPYSVSCPETVFVGTIDH